MRICVLINEGNATARDMYAYSFQAVPVYFIMVYALALASHVREEAIKQLVISCHCVLLSFPRRLGFCRKGLDRSERLRYNVFAPFKPSGFYGAPPASCLAWSLTMSRRGLFFYSVRFSASSALSMSLSAGTYTTAYLLPQIFTAGENLPLGRMHPACSSTPHNARRVNGFLA